jgi:hypothetical protein
MIAGWWSRRLERCAFGSSCSGFAMNGPNYNHLGKRLSLSTRKKARANARTFLFSQHNSMSTQGSPEGREIPAVSSVSGRLELGPQAAEPRSAEPQAEQDWGR